MMRGLLALAFAAVTSGLEVRELRDVGESSDASSEAEKKNLLLKLRLQADARERERATAEREIAAARTKMEVAYNEMKAHEAEAVAAHNREMVEETAKIVEEKTSMDVQKAIATIKAAKEEAAKKQKHEENQRALARAQAKAIEISAGQKYHR